MTFPTQTPHPIGEDLPLHQIEDHEARVLDRLLTQLKEKPVLATLLRIYTRPLQELEGVFWDLQTKRRLADAVGEQLNVIGRILDEPRGPLGDTDYRTILGIKILVLKSSGTAPELIAIASKAAGDVVGYWEYFPCFVAVELLSTPACNPALIARFLRRAKAGGVRLDVWDAGIAARWSSTLSGGGSGFFGSTLSGEVSGEFGGVL